MANFFEELFGDIDIEPSATQLEIEQIFLEGLRSAKVETGDLTEFILNSMGLTTAGESGDLRRLSEEEYIGTLNEAGQLNYRNLTAQLERQSRALEGTLPVSEGLKRQEEDIIRRTVEEGNRLGQQISGSTVEDLFSSTTSGSQRIADLRRTLLTARDTERRGEIQTGQANINLNMGLVSNLRTKDVEQFTTFPGRNLFPIQQGITGLLGDQSIAQARLDQIGQAGTLKAIGTALGIV